jgi:hypothetical protein
MGEQFGAALGTHNPEVRFPLCFQRARGNSLNIFARSTRQLVEAKRRYEQLSKLRTEAMQIVTGEDKDLQKYAHHLRVRSFQRCTFKIQKTKEKTCQRNLKTKLPST